MAGFILGGSRGQRSQNRRHSASQAVSEFSRTCGIHK
jgi:hypothetical protein